MKLDSFYQVLAILCCFVLFSEGCTRIYDPLGRRKRDVEKEEDPNLEFCRSEMKACIKSVDNTLDSTIDFEVLHSEWFERSESEKYCGRYGKASCWINQLKEVFDEHYYLYSEFSHCITEYANKYGSNEGRIRRSTSQEFSGSSSSLFSFRNKRSTANNDEFFCPEFKADNLENTPTLHKTDTTFVGIEDLRVAMQEKLICKKCDCERLEEVLKTAEKESNNYENQEEEIPHDIQHHKGYSRAKRQVTSSKTDCTTKCWYTKMATATKKTSKVYDYWAVVTAHQLSKTSLVCLPQTRILISSANLEKMGITSIENSGLFVGKHKRCSTDSRAVSKHTEAPQECQPKVVKTTFGNAAEFKLPNHKDCMADISVKDDGSISAKYTLTRLPPPPTKFKTPIFRRVCTTVEFECIFVTEDEINSSNLGPIAVTNTELERQYKIQSYKYEVELAWKDLPDRILLNDPLNAVVKFKNSEIDSSKMKLTVKNCWASPFKDRESSSAIKYNLIDCFGCAAKNPGDEGYAIEVRSNNAEEANFKFYAFVWATTTVEPKMYLHCTVRVCNTEVEECPELENCQTTSGKSCPDNRRLRRDINNLDSIHRISSKPIRVHMRGKSSSKKKNFSI